jgi:hypothetical protein
MKRFSDFAQSNQLEGDKKPINELINKEITVLNYRISKSKYQNNSGNLLTIQFELEGKTQVVMTGSEVLLNQCEQYKSEMPFLTTIKKIGNYYTFT